MNAKPMEFIRAVRAEVNKVTWPTRKETTTSAIMVFVMCTVVALFLMFVDWVGSTLIQAILG